MSSPTHLSDSNIRRYGNTNRSKKSLVMYSDYYEEQDDKTNLGQRSISLTALHPVQQPLEPRMAQLETLEAKMASIEVSLSTTPRRKRNCIPQRRDIGKEVEVLRNALRDKENMIQSLKGQLSISRLLRPGQVPLSEKERRNAEERLQRLRQDADNKRLAIKNLKIALERLDITDNIDVRIQQAELEYQLGREELALLSLLEEARGLQAALDLAAPPTLFSCVNGCQHASLIAVELEFDPKSPRFGAGPREDTAGLYVEWAADDAGMMKGDRLLEVNGKLVVSKTREELMRLLAVSPSPAQLVLLRSTQPSLQQELIAARLRAEEAERANVRLSHRISYLEEQVAAPPAPDLHVFQKGPQVTALVANLPGLEVGSTSPSETRHSLPTVKPRQTQSVSNTPIKQCDNRSAKSLDLTSDNSSPRHHIRHEKKHSTNLHNARSTNSLDIGTIHQQLHNRRLSDIQRVKSTQYLCYHSSEPSSETDNHKPTNRKTSDLYNHKKSDGSQQHFVETKSSKSVADLHGNVSNSRKVYKPHDARSVKSLDFDSEPNHTVHHRQNLSSYKSVDYSSETSCQPSRKSEGKFRRPTPPKKPPRLSLHRATSLQSVSSPDQIMQGRKRTHKGELPVMMQTSERTSSTDSCQAALRWPSNLHQATALRAAQATASLSPEKWY